ncbi:MAG: ABC transporter substrate-binding protein [Myxococcales bacterium]|nr:ABC transporter substrate-binding protein [Myxococcales bacterium]MDD9971255.1 ABC transporter substrate-binding protein [Myxococcales bacterium]
MLTTIKLGLLPPLTGIVGMYGEEITRAAHIACQEINSAGGVLGHPLELIIEDDGSLPESAVAGAEKLVAQGCTALVGNLLSNARIAVAYRVAEPNRLPYLNFSFYEGSILSQYFFHFAALPNQQIDRMIPFMRATYGPRMFFAGNAYEWPRGSIAAGKQALDHCGGQTVGEEYFPIGVDPADLDTLLERVEAARPDVFVPYFAGSDQTSLLRKFAARGLKERMAVVMGHYDELMASALEPAVREGLYSSNTYFMTVDTPENQRFLEELAAYEGVTGIWPDGNGILTNFGEGTYLCVKAFAAAADQAGTTDAEALLGALATLRVRGPQGEVRMGPEIQHAAVNSYLSRCRRDGVFEIVERFGVIEPVLPARYRHERLGTRTTLEDEIRLQARILSQLSEAVILVSASDGVVVYNNAAAETLFGCGDGGLLGHPIVPLAGAQSLHPRLGSSELADQLARSGASGGQVSATRRDGTSLWCSITTSAFTHPFYGEVWLIVCRDVSDLLRSLEEKETLLREIHHRVKNNLQIISSLIHFQTKKLHSPEDAASLGELRQRVYAISLVHERLHRSLDVGRVDFAGYLRALVADMSRSAGRFYAAPIDVNVDDLELPIGLAMPAGMIVTELVTNILKYAFPDRRRGTASVSARKEGDQVVLTVADDGVGFPEGFDPRSGGAFGWELVRSLVGQLDGDLELGEDPGVQVRIVFSLREARTGE